MCVLAVEHAQGACGQLDLYHPLDNRKAPVDDRVWVPQAIGEYSATWHQPYGSKSAGEYRVKMAGPIYARCILHSDQAGFRQVGEGPLLNAVAFGLWKP
jgi:hypothetical protein